MLMHFNSYNTLMSLYLYFQNVTHTAVNIHLNTVLHSVLSQRYIILYIVYFGEFHTHTIVFAVVKY